MIINSKLLFKWKVAVSLGLLLFIITPILISSLIRPTTDSLLDGNALKSNYSLEISISKINVEENIATVKHYISEPYLGMVPYF